MDNVIDLTRGANVLPKKSKVFCRCIQVFVDEHTRALECQSCGKIIDPFDYMMGIANKHQRALWSTEILRDEEAKLQKEVDELKRQKRNLKSQVKRLG